MKKLIIILLCVMFVGCCVDREDFVAADVYCEDKDGFESIIVHPLGDDRVLCKDSTIINLNEAYKIRYQEDK